MGVRRLAAYAAALSAMALAVLPAPLQDPTMAGFLSEYSERERHALARLTALEAASVQDPTVSARIAAARAELQGIAEIQSEVRFVLRLEEELSARETDRRSKAARLAKLERTLELLRRDNDARARGYLDRLDASIAPTDAVARAFARSQAEIERELDAFESRENEAFLKETNATASERRRLDEEVERSRGQLREAYAVAAAAKRLLDDGSWTQLTPRGNASGDGNARGADFAAVDAVSPSFAALRASLAASLAEQRAAEEALHAEEAALVRLGLTAPAPSGSRGGGDNASTAVDAASTAASEALATASATQVERLIATVRHLLSLNAAAQLDAGRYGGEGGARRRRRASGAAEAGESSLRSWTQSAGELEAEIAGVEAQRASLERARRALEEELARRAARAGRLAVTLRPGDAEGPALPPGAAALVAAAEAAGGVGPGATPAELRHGPVVEELLRSDGLEPAVNFGTGAGPGYGGGAGGVGTGCSFCRAQRNIARLEDAIGGLRADLRECGTSPERFKPNCAPRLQFQIDRLSGDLRRRRLVRGGVCLCVRTGPL